MRSEARAAGRDPDALTISSTIFVPMLADSPDAARQFAGMVDGLFGIGEDEVRRMPLALIGTPDEWVAELERRSREWGVGHYILSGLGDPSLIERFANEVMPRLT